jgi:hypothetical protein
MDKINRLANLAFGLKPYDIGEEKFLAGKGLPLGQRQERRKNRNRGMSA